MTAQRYYLENLVVLARRDQLTDEQAETLSRHLGNNALANDLYRWGKAFDSIGSAQSGDESVVSRAVEAALRKHQSRVAPSIDRPKPRQLVTWLAAAILVGTSASALAMISTWHPRRLLSAWVGEGAAVTKTSHVVAPHSSSTKTGVSMQPLVPSRLEARKLAPSATPSDSALPSLVPSALGSRKIVGSTARAIEKSLTPHEPQAARVELEPIASTQPNATQLFELAGVARKRGRMTESIRLYRELQKLYPDSGEAQLSHISLGKLLQSQGDVGGSVSEYQAYLKRPGSLTEEALIECASGLGQLGRVRAQLSLLQRLVTEYPSSVYVSRAQARISELTRSGESQ